MRRVAVLATGGTIATRTDQLGTAVAGPAGKNFSVTCLCLPDRGRCRGRLPRRQLCDDAGAPAEGRRCVDEHFRDDVVDIVITHGTDTTEETAILLDLVLGDPRPIVLTDAQRPAEPRTATDPATSRMPLPWRRIPPLGDCARSSSPTGCAPRSRDRRQ